MSSGPGERRLTCPSDAATLWRGGDQRARKRLGKGWVHFLRHRREQDDTRLSPCGRQMI